MGSLLYKFLQMNSEVGWDWKQDKDRPHEQLWSKVFNYCVDILKIDPLIFSGENQYFAQYVCDLNLSGGWEWFNPTYSLTLGLKHGLTEEFLDTQAITYHGVRDNKNVPLILKSQLRAGKGQAYQGRQSKNPDVKVPHGVYCSQFLNTTMGYVNPNFPIVFQIASPRQYVTSNKDISVVLKAVPLKIVFPFRNAPRQPYQ